MAMCEKMDTRSLEEAGSSGCLCLEASGNRLQHECMACLLSTAMPHAMQESAADTHTTPIEDSRQPACQQQRAAG
ncbi:hypothetical protein E4U13_007285 [Claviceps humidiphila]|uniref:Uncharacterized protein n=1 Tax=Claviceps humidiphila TaxID=1294629 RepID=A0A9P7TY86_9HYPO|nr:hypothetical protein E4U13_007285 [Claviceps humidiphila]